MKKILFPLFLMCIFGSFSAHGQKLLSPQKVIRKSIKYHDPARKWYKMDKKLLLSEIPSQELKDERGKFNQEFEVSLFRNPQQCKMEFLTEGKHQILDWEGEKEVCQTLEEGKSVEKIETGIGVLNCVQVPFWRDYLDFLFSMPMNLQGVEFQELTKVSTVQFNEKTCFQFSGRYSEGKHLYTFYFDQEDYSLEGIRFSTDGTLENGEYLLYEGETQVGRIRLPAKRSWYYNKGDGFLATDEIRGWQQIK